MPPRPDFERQTYAKVTWRLLPFLIACYMVAYLDRVNVGFAKLQMLADLGFSETVYGLGAGLFFIGYFFFEVPSNVILYRVGARIWIGRIMITWGLISAAFVFVSTPTTFYVMRFLLGAAEAGFYPGILLYLTSWYPVERRARIIATFMLAVPISGIFGGPLSGWIMGSFAGHAGWSGWQWMFLIEAVPAVVMGVAALFYLDNGIRAARWLTDSEKDLLEANLRREDARIPNHASMRAVFADPRIWFMCAIYFTCVMGQYGLTFWLPTLIQVAGAKSVFEVGLLTAIPYSGAAVTMLLLGKFSDRTGQRRLYAALPLVIGAAGLLLSTFVSHQTLPSVVALTVAAAGILSAAPLFWSLPTAFLGGLSAAAGIATVNSVGNLAGFVSPYMVGWIKDATASTSIAMYVLAAVMLAGAVAIYRVPAALVDRR